ncbi:MAG: DUF1761 domain-containing protein [Phenylobacterium sp.]
MLKGINWISVLVAFVAVELLGYLWYAVVFSKDWMAEMTALGLKPDTSSSGQTTALAIGAVLIVLQVLGVSWLLQRIGATTLMAGVTGALTAYVFFALPTQGMEYAYMGFPAKLMAINCGQLLIAYLLAGAVLGGLKLGRPAAAAAA